MNILYIVSTVIGVAAFTIGCIMALPDERATGQTLIIGGAIIIAGILIGAAILGAVKKLN